MANAFFKRFLPSPNAPGFTLTEAMISVAIIGLMSLIVVVDLRSSQKKEQLITAARVIAGDLRSMQTRALTAQNLKTCLDGVKNITCELSTTACADPMTCKPLPPYAVGGHFVRGGTSYAFFADVDIANKDFMETPAKGELFLTRDLAISGAQNVVIDDLLAPGTKTDANVAFERQNGIMHISPCPSGACLGVSTLTIRLRQTQSGDTKDITLNALTGRISIE